MTETTPKPKHPGGRPTSYRKEYCEQATKLSLLGATDKEMADFFNVSVSTFNLWKIEHSEFSDSLKDGKDKLDNRVKQSLYRRAMGYSHPDVHISNYQGEITITPIEKHYPPDTTAAIFWLKNRQPAEFRDRVEHELSGKITLDQLVASSLEPSK